MATSDILGLFATPEQYQAQQMAGERQQAGLLANMSPAQLANYGAAMGGQQLGRGLGSLFGAQDPQLQMITRRQQLLSQINPGDPQALLRAAQQAGEMGDPQMALQLTDFANRQASEIAQQQQRLAAAGKERAQSIPARVGESRELGVLTTALAALEQTPQTPERDLQMTMLRTQISALERPEKMTPDMSNAAALADLTSTDRNSDAWKQEYKSQLTRLTTKPENEKKSAYAQELIDGGYIPGSPMYISMMDKYLEQKLAPKEEKDISFGADREAIASEMFEGKRFKDLTPPEKAKVNKRKEAEDNTRASLTAPKTYMPGQKEAGILDFRTKLRNSLDPYISTIDNGDSALAALKNARTPDGKTNPSSFTQGVAYLASMAQSGRLSNRDVELVKEDPAVLRSLGNYISTKWEGVPLQPTIDEITKTVKIIRKVAKAKYDRELKAQRRLAELANIPADARDALFEEIKIDEKPAPASNRKAVDFNTLPKSNP
jgi:hypothetical protein